MNARQFRLVAGFVVLFALLSAVPMMSGLRPRFEGLLANVELTEQVGDLLILAAVGLIAAIGIIALRRRFLARPKRVIGSAVARSRPSRSVTVRQPAKSPAVARESALATRLRKAAVVGVRVPDLARQFGLSQDAVRSALGRQVNPPAARTGSSFRSRQPTPPAKPRAVPVAPKRIAYQVTG